MSWDESFANHYEEWSTAMTADVPFYVELARNADGPLVEPAIGTGRLRSRVAQATGRNVIGIVSSPAMRDKPVRERRRLTWSSTGATRHARLRSWRSGGADLLPVPRAPAPANLGGPTAHVRTRRRIHITLDDGGTTSLWWATKNEWLGLLDVAGLHLEAL